ncbi:hypothetical protein ACXITP_05060 [Actinotignum sanguinis]|uniref:Uncharacterized protein n=2 Tax=Actinomycetaceae TaxID=2049 RepID=A0ABZ0R9H3_9ACTO|nr:MULTISPECIES: hypothetical protein [Actinotignum]WPJ88446.1 hypothetical protein R0V15_06105 [Schaalia turicensis]MDE1578015.1 hypothetical protein [Actinotignum sanguinis]MDE1655790.1 hypothetical protein [Actinotignum sanguinis]MDK6373476.1 hypothetical protein [Actinotignum timonense]MDK6591181.1 hypothetical protein [Actinotignum timonense]
MDATLELGQSVVIQCWNLNIADEGVYSPELGMQVCDPWVYAAFDVDGIEPEHFSKACGVLEHFKVRVESREIRLGYNLNTLPEELWGWCLPWLVCGLAYRTTPAFGPNASEGEDVYVSHSQIDPLVGLIVANHTDTCIGTWLGGECLKVAAFTSPGILTRDTVFPPASSQIGAGDLAEWLEIIPW